QQARAVRSGGLGARLPLHRGGSVRRRGSAGVRGSGVRLLHRPSGAEPPGLVALARARGGGAPDSGDREGDPVADAAGRARAGGCVWGMQDLIRKRPGVLSTRVGYTGGNVDNATYRNHGTHAEAIEIVFDPQQTSYRELLEFFFQIHDPTTVNRQGNDVGMS